jgi:polyisoprenoid-binding protein YceI
MKKAVLFAVSLLTTLSLFAAPRVYTVTSDGKNYAMFTSEATLETIHGRTTNVVGTVNADPANSAGSVVDVTIDLASLDTGIGMRNDHMRNKFLQVDKFPSAIFKSVSVSGPKTIEANKPIELQVTGDLTLHGVTKRITVPVHVVLIPDSERTKAGRGPGDWVHATTDFNIKLTDYAIAVPDALVMKLSDGLTIHLDVFANAK